MTQQAKTDRPVKVFEFNQKDEVAKKKKAASLAQFSMKIRNSDMTNISKIVQAKHDPYISDVFRIPPNESDDYAVIEIFGDRGMDQKLFTLQVKKFQGFMATNNIRCVAFKEYHNETPTCKFVCKIS